MSAASGHGVGDVSDVRGDRVEVVGVGGDVLMCCHGSVGGIGRRRRPD